MDVTDSAPTPHTARFDFAIFAAGQSSVGLYVTALSGSGQKFTDATRADYAINFINIGGGVPPYTCAVSPGSSLPSGTQILPWTSIDTTQYPARCYLIGSTSAAGTHSFSIRATDSVGDLADFPVTWHVSPIGLWTEYPGYNSNQAFLGRAYNQPLLPFGGTPPYTITPLLPYPVGLSIGSGDPFGTLIGTPLEAAPYLQLFPTITDSAGNTFTSPGGMQISAGAGIITLTINGGPIAAATAGTLYQFNLDVFGPVHNPPYTVSLLRDPAGPNPSNPTLPTGLKLVTSGFDNFNDTNAVAAILGTPTESGDFAYLLKIEDAQGNFGQRAITLHVAGAGQSVNVSNDVQITTSAFTYDRKTKIHNGTVTVTNTSTATLNGPLSVVLTQLTPGVTAISAAGTLASGPYYTFSSLPLSPGQSGRFDVQFTDPANARIGFVPKTYSGQPQ